MKRKISVLDKVVKPNTIQIQLCAKAAPIKEQIYNRSLWQVDQVEILLDGLRHLEILKQMLKYTSELFPKFNVEVGYQLDKFSPTDLTDPRSQEYILRVAEECKKFKNFDRLVMHLVGGSIVLDKDAGYKLGHHTLPYKSKVLEKCKNFLQRLDPTGSFIALENTYPVDCNSNGIVVYPCGKVSEDFIGFPRVIDTAHLGISAVTYAETKKDGLGRKYGIYHLSETEVPVYLGEKNSEERELGHRAKTNGITEAVLWQIKKDTSNVVEIHLCGNYDSDKRQKDGAGFEDNSVIDLNKIFLEIIKKTYFSGKLIVIPEIKEHDGDYIEARRQRKMMNQLKNMIQK